MGKLILKVFFAAIAYLAWMFTGASAAESLFIAVVFLGILLLEPIPFQTKEEREKLIKKINDNRERIQKLHDKRKGERQMMIQESNRRAQREAKLQEKMSEKNKG